MSMLTVGACVPLTRGLLHYPMFLGQELRYGIAAAILALVAWRRGERPPSQGWQWRRLAAIAALSLVPYNLFLLTALKHADPAMIATVLGAAPLGLALVGPMLARRRPGAAILVSATVVVAGTAVVQGTGHADPIGLGAAFGALLTDMAFSLLASTVVAALGPTVVAATTCGLAVPMFAAVGVASGEVAVWRTPTAAEAAIIAVLAIVLTAASFVSWFSGLARLGVARAGLTIAWIPLASLVATSVLDHTWPTIGQSAGVAVVMTGLLLAATARAEHPPLADLR
jgi:drug/metabolite transporter (DMT)-like permease